MREFQEKELDTLIQMAFQYQEMREDEELHQAASSMVQHPASLASLAEQALSQWDAQARQRKKAQRRLLLVEAAKRATLVAASFICVVAIGGAAMMLKHGYSLVRSPEPNPIRTENSVLGTDVYRNSAHYKAYNHEYTLYQLDTNQPSSTASQAISVYHVAEEKLLGY